MAVSVGLEEALSNADSRNNLSLRIRLEGGEGLRAFEGSLEYAESEEFDESKLDGRN